MHYNDKSWRYSLPHRPENASVRVIVKHSLDATTMSSIRIGETRCLQFHHALHECEYYLKCTEYIGNQCVLYNVRLQAELGIRYTPTIAHCYVLNCTSAKFLPTPCHCTVDDEFQPLRAGHHDRSPS